MVLCACICMLFTVTARACDGCGSSVNANYMGILPQFRQHFVGIRYLNNSTTSVHPPSLFDTRTISTAERFQRAEVWGRFYPARRVQVFAFVPYQVISREEEGITSVNKGIGDLSVMASYLLVNTGDSGRLSLRNTLLLGGGVKAPTGKFDPSGTPSLQTGTGSWDFMLNMIYTLRYKKAGMNVDANARLNTTNSRNYAYGNAYSSSLRFFYWHRKKTVSFLPHAGMLFEHTDKDVSNLIIQRYSGGNGWYASAGLDLYVGKVSFGASYAVPLKEHLYEGLVTTNNRLSLQAIYLF